MAKDFADINRLEHEAGIQAPEAGSKDELVNKFVKAWENQTARRVAKGGTGLTMALTLAACGSDSSGVVSTSGETDGEEPPTPTVTPVTLALTTGNDILTATDFTTAADTITADQDTYIAADVIVEGTAGDGDTLTITTDADITATPTVVGIENIIVNASLFGAAGTGIDFAADGIADGTITLNHVQAGSSVDTATVTGAGDVTVVAGTNVDTFDVTMVEDASTIVDAGEATAVIIRSANDAAAVDQVATFVANGDVLLTVDGGAGTLTDVNITATVASEVSFDDVNGDVDTITGDANTTLVATAIGGLSQFDGLTITGVAGVEGDGATADVTGIDAPITITGITPAVLTVADGASIVAGVDGVDISLVAEDDGDAATAIEQTATVTASAASLGAPSLELQLFDSATGDGISTLNLVVDEDMAAAAGAVAFNGGASLDETLNISGSEDIDLALFAGAGEITVNATALTGELTTVATADVVSITGGSGDDTITLDADGTVEGDITIIGGAGTDTLVADGGGSDVTAMTISGIEVVTGNFTLLASQVDGADVVVTAGSSLNLNVAGTSIDTTTIDLSEITFADATDAVNVDLTAIDPAIVLAGAGFTYTGSDAADSVIGSANADVINGGAGDDVITGGAGDDTLTGGDGADTFANADIDNNGIDTITDFATGTDVIELSIADLNALTGGATFTVGVGGVVAQGGDFLQIIATDGAGAADAAATGHDGTFIYDSNTGNLIFDASGDTTYTDDGTGFTDANADDIVFANIDGAGLGSILDGDINFVA